MAVVETSIPRTWDATAQRSRSADQTRWLTRFSRRSWPPDRGRGSIPPAATRASSSASEAESAQDLRAEALRPAGVAALPLALEVAGLDEVGRHEQRARQRVDAADVGVEQVGPIEALAAELRVEVEPAGGEAAGPDDLVQGERQLLDRVRELVGVPAVLRRRRGSRRCCRRCRGRPPPRPRGGSCGRRGWRG